VVMRNLNRKGTEPQRKSFKISAASHKWECSRPQIHRLKKVKRTPACRQAGGMVHMAREDSF
jgi:hypothetical protein